MQSEPSAVQKVSSESPTSGNAPTTSQHGLQFDGQPRPLHPDDEEQRVSDPRIRPDTRSHTPSPRPIAVDINDATPLNEGSASPWTKIAEYENASVKSPRRRSDGPLFDVIKKNRPAGDKSCPIEKLPNELLTHAISHLSPNDLSAVSLVSRRFNNLVTEPHAWRVAFARYFPGPESLVNNSTQIADDNAGDIVRSEKRSFTRLTALASWRSEYILRTRLLRSLARGKPVQAPATPASVRSGQTQLPTNPVITYDARTYTTINHLHASFGTGLNKRVPRFIHAADDVGFATMSDPTTGKVDSWGRTDPFFYHQFSELNPGVAEYGLGAGEVVGCPNVMDVSQPNGMIYGQGAPQGRCYFRNLEAQRGRFIAETTDLSMPEMGIPKLGENGGAICCVWIAKTSVIPSLSEGTIGMLIGSAAGVVTSCSLGTDGLRGQRLQCGELTSRWVLSPGVPIVAIAVDENYSLKRQAQNRIWAVALNALGELFYLTKFPTRSTATKDAPEEHRTEYLAWLTGRSVYWNVVEPSRRTARPNPYKDGETDGTYSPRSSWDGMCLGKQQVRAETAEIQQYLRMLPKDFRKLCLGWDMRRRLEVDFAGDDGTYAGEAMVVFDCGTEEDDVADVTRYTRFKVHEKEKVSVISPTFPQQQSLFGGSTTPDPSNGPSSLRSRSSSYISSGSSPERTTVVEEWRCSKFSFGGLKSIEITTTTLDNSTFATLSLSEDPALGFSGPSTASSPYASPMSVASQPSSPSDIPGQRARFMAAGTKLGIVLVWDIRAPISRSSEFVNTIDPVRIIYTESPEISCLGMTALHIVHGGNDGLVQAWDPLASTTQPIRTLNSRFSSRARRRLAQAQTSVQGVGINMFAAGAICLDPDPTVLRGAVSLGSQIRYWSYSSSAADQYKSSKRQLRRSERGNNHAGERFTPSGRGNMKDYIANEKLELEREEMARQKQAYRLAGRFGVNLLENEDEALAYATLLSQEALEVDRQKQFERDSKAALSRETVTPEPSEMGHLTSRAAPDVDEMDEDMKEAIRLSLQETSISDPYIDSPATDPDDFGIPIRYAKGNRKSPSKSTPKKNSHMASPSKAGGSSCSNRNELSDLEFALQLSLAEEQSRKEMQGEVEAFPPLRSTPGGKEEGKGKGRMW